MKLFMSQQEFERIYKCNGKLSKYGTRYDYLSEDGDKVYMVCVTQEDNTLTEKYFAYGVMRNNNNVLLLKKQIMPEEIEFLKDLIEKAKQKSVEEIETVTGLLDQARQNSNSFFHTLPRELLGKIGELFGNRKIHERRERQQIAFDRLQTLSQGMK